MREKDIPGREKLKFELKQPPHETITEFIVTHPIDWLKIHKVFQSLSESRWESLSKNTEHLASLALACHTGMVLDEIKRDYPPFIRYPVVSPENADVSFQQYRFVKNKLGENGTFHIDVFGTGRKRGDRYTEYDEMYMDNGILTVVELKIENPRKTTALGNSVNNNMLNKKITPLQAYAHENSAAGIQGFNFVLLSLPDLSNRYANSVIDFQQQGGIVRSFQTSYTEYMDHIADLQLRLGSL